MESDENIRPSKNGTTNDSHVELDTISRQENAENQGSAAKQKRTNEKLITKLEDHFKDPYTRVCRNRGIKRFPEKLMLLPFVWFFCTYQLILFGDDRSQFATFVESNAIAMKHLLLKDWTNAYETMPYPPSSGVYAIYTIDDLLDHINYTIVNVYTIPTTSVGSFFVRKLNVSDIPVTMCLHYYHVGVYDEIAEHIDTIDLTRTTECKDIGIDYTLDYGFNPSIGDLMRSTDGKLVRLLNIEIKFQLSSVHLNIETGKTFKCFGIYGSVVFDNSNINGQITVKLKTNIEEVKCNERKEIPDNTHHIVISVLVLIFCALHTVCCFQSWVTSVVLFWKTRRYYKEEKGKLLSLRACWEIFKLNDFISFFANIATVVGSIMKIYIDQGQLTRSILALYDSTGILLGLGCLFTWLSVLHYLAYDHVFSLLFSVMERSACTVIKFLACVSILFAGFALCAWVVLGPYHIKFTSLTSTFQSLLALINGDEIYVTFTAVDSDKQLVGFFNSVFLVVFLALFTLITLNIFIAIFNTAYEHQHDNEYKKEHRSDLMKLLDINEAKSFDTPACSKCVRQSCPSMLGCMRCCDDDRYNRKNHISSPDCLKSNE